MWRHVAARIARLKVKAGCAVASHRTVGHRLAALDSRGILEIEQDVGFGRRVECFGVPSWIAVSFW